MGVSRNLAVAVATVVLLALIGDGAASQPPAFAADPPSTSERTVIDFESVPDGSPDGFYDGVTFGHPAWVWEAAGTRAVCPLQVATVSPHVYCYGSMTIGFDTPVNDVGFNVLAGSIPKDTLLAEVRVTEAKTTPTGVVNQQTVVDVKRIGTAIDQKEPQDLSTFRNVVELKITVVFDSFNAPDNHRRPMFDDISFTRCSGTNDPNNVPAGKPLDSNWGSWPDGDNDGLPDKWETDGVWVEGKFLDLPAEGVSVRQPDLFVYADAEAGWGLNDAVFSYLQSAFATSPLLVKVHVIRGSTPVPSALVAGWNGADLAAFQRVQEASGFDETMWAGGCGVPQLAKYSLNLRPGSMYDADGPRPDLGGTSQVQGDAFTTSYDPSWFGAALRTPSRVSPTSFATAANLMHELGHALGLPHSNPEDDPRYLSVMSSAYSNFGIYSPTSRTRIDYSRYWQVNLDWLFSKQIGKLTFIRGQWDTAFGRSVRDGRSGEGAGDFVEEAGTDQQIADAAPESVAAFVEEFGLEVGNHSPVATSGALRVAQGTKVPVPFQGADPDGDVVTFRISEPPEHGDLIPTASGFAYAPDAGYTGPDSITFRAFDGYLSSTWETMRIEVTSGPSDQPEPPASTDAQRAFVTAVYLDFVGRLPTAEEAATLSADLDDGTLTRRQFIEVLARTPAWAEARVTELYRTTLDRAGESSGVRWWTDALRSGRRTLAQTAAAFYSSSEYYRSRPGGSDGSWIEALYEKLLGRQPDAAGLRHWVSNVASHGRTSVALNLFQSAESRRARVGRLYQELLGRAADAPGLAHWANRVQTEGDLELAIELASSDEYAARAAHRFP